MGQYLKFFGLLFLLEKKEPNGWILIVDGPESILDFTRSYGIKIFLIFFQHYFIEVVDNG